MKYKDVQSMAPQELRDKLNELRLALGKLEFQRASKTLTKSHEIRMIKKDIARIQTALTS